MTKKLFVNICIWCIFTFPLPSAASQTTNTHLPGIDVSRYQGDNINWIDLKKQGIKFVYIKATQGETEVDQDFEKHRAMAKQAGILHGFYHFFQPEDDPVKQASHFLKTVGDTKNCLPSVVDVEILGRQQPDKVVSRMKTWMKLVKEALGHEPILYSYHYFFREYLKPNLTGTYKLWLADYQRGYDFSKNLNVIFAQHSESGKIEGISDNVDLDWFEGSYKKLEQLVVH